MARARWQFDAPSLRRSDGSRRAVIDDQGRPLVRMQCLGAVAALVGDDRLDSSSDTLFALLVRSVYSPGCAVSRDVLLRSLWPAQTDHRQRANLRQALYKLRLHGVRIGLKGDEVQLDPTQLAAVFAVERSVSRFDEDVTRGDEPFGVFLPGYQTGWAEYDEWLVMQREAVHSDVRRVLVGQLGVRRERADWTGADALARWLLQFDPLNEEATLTVAECLARNGSKAEAVALIDRYMEDLGPDAGDLRLSATLLRRRITEPQRGGKQRISLAPTDRHFVGRDALMSDLTLSMRRSKWGEGSALMLHAAPGMGKTRVTQELSKSAALEGHRVIAVECRESDQYRPLSLFLSLVPDLLDMPGAMACDPERLRVLRRFASQEDDAGMPIAEAPVVDGSLPTAAAPSQMPLPLPSVLRRCIVELLVNVCYERATVLIADNMQWVDELSASVLADIAGASREAKLFVLATSRVATTEPVKRMIAGGMEARALPGLSDESAQRLADLICADTGMTCSSEQQDWFVRASEGTPLFLRGLLHHWVDTGAAGGIPPTLASLLDQRISALSEDALRIVQAASVLGRHATIQTIAEVLELPVIRMIGALEELGDAGAYAPSESGLIVFHELMSRSALFALSSATRQLLHARASNALQLFEPESDNGVAVDIVEHMRLARMDVAAINFAGETAVSYLKRGHPHRALAVCEAIRPQDNRSSALQAVQRVQISAWYAAGQHSNILAALSHPFESACADPTWDEENAEDVLIFIEASRAGALLGDCQDIAARAILLAKSHRMQANLRIRAAMVALKLASVIPDSVLAKQAYDAVTVNAVAVDIVGRLRHELDLYFHTWFGDHTVACACARWLLVDAESYTDRTERLSIRAQLAYALRVCGDCETAYLVCRESYDDAQKAGMLTTAAYFAWNASAIAFDFLHDLDVAQQWLHQDILNSAELSEHNLGVVLQQNRVRLAALRGDSAGARYALRCIDERNIDFATPFRSAYFYAVKLSVLILEKDADTASSVLPKALEAFAITKSLIGQDFMAEQLVHALILVNRSEEASSLLDSYLRNDRRPGLPLPRYLETLSQSCRSQFREPVKAIRSRSTPATPNAAEDR